MSAERIRRAATILGVLLFLSFCAKGPERQAGSTATAAPLPATPPSAGEPWTDLGISRDRQPQRLLIRKIVWRGGPEALVLEGAEVRRLHALLAGNQRAAYACGYHWSLDFEYGDGAVESLAINEDCESFRRSGDDIWAILRPSFQRASERPSHYLVRLEVPPEQKLAVERQLEPHFGTAFNTEPRGKTLLLGHPEPWTPERVEALRRAVPDGTRVEQIERYDRGS